MTVQEAINMIRYKIETASEIAGKGADGKAFEDLDMAIEALEKQIPKKPIEIHEVEDGSFYTLTFMCPSCDTAVIGQHYRPKYCKHCGQKLDWGE